MASEPIPPWMIPYFAGIIDGDGCISLARHKKQQLTVLIQVSMTDRRVVDLLHRYYGGGKPLLIQKGSNCKPQYAWKLVCKKAELFLRDIQPFLVIKREQCELALAVREAGDRRGLQHGGATSTATADKDQEIVRFREEAKTKMHELNRRGLH